jgi:hypothetical protein
MIAQVVVLKVKWLEILMKLHGSKILWRGMVWYGMVWYGMVWYGMVW